MVKLSKATPPSCHDHKTRNIYGFVDKISNPICSVKSVIIIRNTDLLTSSNLNNSTIFDPFLIEGKIGALVLRTDANVLMYIYN